MFSNIICPRSIIKIFVGGVRIWEKNKPELILFRLDLKIN